MDPFTLAFGVAGLATSLFGGAKASSDASQIAGISQQIAGVSQNIFNTEKQENNVRQQAMEVSGRRMQLENVRNMQRARANAVQAGVNQGAQFGSGMAGGIADVTAQGTFNLQGINQNLMTGRQMFGLSNQISDYRSQEAGLQGRISALQGNMNTYQGLSNFGGAIMRASPMLGPLAQQGFGGMNFNSLFGGGSPSGYGV